jgi:hypothetical protein
VIAGFPLLTHHPSSTTNKYKHHYVTINMTTSFRFLIVSLSLLSVTEAFVAPRFSRRSEIPSASALSMVVRNKGLEVRRDGATPTGE